MRQNKPNEADNQWLPLRKNERNLVGMTIAREPQKITRVFGEPRGHPQKRSKPSKQEKNGTVSFRCHFLGTSRYCFTKNVLIYYNQKSKLSLQNLEDEMKAISALKVILNIAKVALLILAFPILIVLKSAK